MIHHAERIPSLATKKPVVFGKTCIHNVNGNSSGRDDQSGLECVVYHIIDIASCESSIVDDSILKSDTKFIRRCWSWIFNATKDL